jgi:hypothetical protein
MTKKVLLSGVVGIFIFSGCLGMNDVKPSTQKAKVNVTKVKNATDKIEDVKSKVKEVATPPESSMKDKVIEEEVEISDDNEENSKPQIIESVQ